MLTLYSGEWFENMRSQDLANSANIPDRRETFSTKRIVLDFDSGLNLADMADVAGDARMKPLTKLLHDIDSIKEHNDSVGYSFYTEAKRYGLRLPTVSAEDSVKIMKQLATDKTTFDSIYERQSPIDRQSAVKSALASVQSVKMDVEMKADYARSLHRYYHHRQLEAIKKFTLSLSSLIFVFIGAPLGSIIRKGGIAIPLVFTVGFFGIYFALSVIGEKIAKGSVMPVWFGTWMSSLILLPLCVFLTYHATMDTAVLSPDTYSKMMDKIKNFKLFSKKRHENPATLS